MKKIIGVMFVAIFAGVPFLAMASWSFLYCQGDILTTGTQSPSKSADYQSQPECVNAKVTYTSPTYYNVGSCMSPGATPYSLCNGTLPGSLTSDPAGALTSAPLSVSVPLMNPIKYNTFSSFVSKVTATAVEILMPFVVLAFIYSGFLFVRAQGNETELKEAKSAIKWSIIGAFILMGAYGFSQIICTTVESLTADGTSISSCR